MTVFRCKKCGLEIHEEDPDRDTRFCDRVKCSGTMYRMDTVEGLQKLTFLSERQAEAYLLVSEEHEELTAAEAAEEMGISEGNVSGKIGKIREKMTEGEATNKLSI
ncbi:hypothetical protein KY092_07960 [Natronomonas gomsonensis]|uniref:sigma factor-like helix-turn-helix DNA-binding protein n=1 Tax=Natronomonas gomsonensis TaxID=1046043 RepID=UPI0020CA7F52|nr:sigma factor-like helix-turn-helix DNA-binding protein [Natronomonas gomsonensis]MCY4730491.1 hypothetical protein [Natronomonas gomsonensis]